MVGEGEGIVGGDVFADESGVTVGEGAAARGDGKRGTHSTLPTDMVVFARQLAHISVSTVVPLSMASL
jgi:hypothetical protein